MKKKKISLTVTTALAALLLSACGQSDSGWSAQNNTAICVDRDHNRVPDWQCQGGGHGGYYPYYIARNSVIPPYGGYASAGSMTRTSGATYFSAPLTTQTSVAPETSVSRGGFGSSFSGGEGVGE